MKAEFRWLGEGALLVRLGEGIDPEVNARVRRLAAALDAAGIPGLVETVPTYRSVLVIFDPLITAPGALRQAVEEVLGRPDVGRSPGYREIVLPVAYGGEFGPDLELVCSHTGLAPDEVVAKHAGRVYLVYMLGFLPGFAYAGDLSPELEVPRLPQPRVRVPRGSVAIAGRQTGIYSLDSPGGWMLIGRTPVPTYRPRAAEPFLLRPGDRLRFLPISPEQYRKIEAQVRTGQYRLQVKEVSPE